MEFKEKYNKMVEIIECNISLSNEMIENELCKCFGENLRLLADAFKFISGSTLSKYIRERKLINAMLTKRLEDISYDEVAEMFGFADAASLSKSAKSLFGKSPSQMSAADLSNFVPLTLEVILKDNSCTDNQAETKTIADGNRTTSFGVTENQYSEIRKTLTIAAVYGLSDGCAELAYMISKNADIPLDRSCDFVSDYLLQVENGSCCFSYPIEDLALLSYKYDLSYSESQHIMFELEAAGILSFSELPKYFFEIYFSDENSRLGLCVEEICEIAEEMDAHGLTIKDLFDVVDRGMWDYGGDIIEAIYNFKTDKAEWERVIDCTLHMTDEEIEMESKYYDYSEEEY